MLPTLATLTERTAEEGANPSTESLAAALVDWAARAVAQTGIRQIALWRMLFEQGLASRGCAGNDGAGNRTVAPQEVGGRRYRHRLGAGLCRSVDGRRDEEELFAVCVIPALSRIQWPAFAGRTKSYAA